jgi:CheY-like chemotaxis protein
MKILIVEDDPTDMKLLSAVLNSSGHRIFGEVSAEQALEEIKVHQPELILPDLNLAGMDGLALARLLKQNPETRRIPIVAVTAGAEKFSKREALDAGCDAFILKPVDTRELPAQVASLAAHHTKSPRQ